MNYILEIPDRPTNEDVVKVTEGLLGMLEMIDMHLLATWWGLAVSTWLRKNQPTWVYRAVNGEDWFHSPEGDDYEVDDWLPKELTTITNADSWNLIKVRSGPVQIFSDRMVIGAGTWKEEDRITIHYP